LRIFRLDWEGEWKEEERGGQVLYENTEDKPYGFVVPQGASFGQPVAVVAAPEGARALDPHVALWSFLSTRACRSHDNPSFGCT
jgi:hypothetical protein